MVCGTLDVSITLRRTSSGLDHAQFLIEHAAQAQRLGTCPRCANARLLVHIWGFRFIFKEIS